MRVVISLLMVFLIVAAFSTTQNAQTSDGIPFTVSSLNTPFAMQGYFEGEYRVHPGLIEIRVKRADIRISENCPYKGRRLLSAVSFGLATNLDGKKWKIAYRGQEHFLELIMSAGGTAQLGELNLNIPIDPTIDLSKHWFVVQMNDTALDVPKEERVAGYAFAHSSRDIFKLPIQ